MPRSWRTRCSTRAPAGSTSASPQPRRGTGRGPAADVHPRQRHRAGVHRGKRGTAAARARAGREPVPQRPGRRLLVVSGPADCVPAEPAGRAAAQRRVHGRGRAVAAARGRHRRCRRRRGHRHRRRHRAARRDPPRPRGGAPDGDVALGPGRARRSQRHRRLSASGSRGPEGVPCRWPRPTRATPRRCGTGCPRLPRGSRTCRWPWATSSPRAPGGVVIRETTLAKLGVPPEQLTLSRSEKLGLVS